MHIVKKSCEVFCAHNHALVIGVPMGCIMRMIESCSYEAVIQFTYGIIALLVCILVQKYIHLATFCLSSGLLLVLKCT